MASNINYWKWGVIAAAAAALFLFGRSCGVKSVTKHTGIDTVIYRDTTIIRYQPTPYKVIEQVYVQGKPYPVIVKEPPYVMIEPVDTAAILADYNRTRLYDTTIALKRGTARIADTVTRNRITGRSLVLTGTDTTIRETVILRPPRRLVGYIDLTGMAGRHDVGMGAGFSLKLPSDRSYGVGVQYLWNGKVMYYGRASIPIRLK
jgi:hypothetical protein